MRSRGTTSRSLCTKGDKAEGTPIETVTNDEKGNITFQPINYTEAGDYEYTIKEVTGNDQTIVYDGQKVKVKVSVTDNKNGTLDATVTYGGDKAVPTFTNVKPTTDVTVEATKVLAGKALTDGAFAFGLYQGDTSTGNPVKIVQNDKEGKINLALTGLTIGEYDYKLKEGERRCRSDYHLRHQGGEGSRLGEGGGRQGEGDRHL